MARIAGVNIPTNKRVTIGLRYIYGIGPTKAADICTRLSIPDDRRVNQLSDEEVNALLSQMMQEEHSHTGNGHKNGEDDGYKEGTTNGISPQEAARLLAQLDQLSDEHVDSLLSQIVQEEE